MINSQALSGLSDTEVATRIATGQTNKQNSKTSRTVANILYSNIFTLFNAVVGGSFLLLLVLGQWQDALFGLAVIANVSIGVIQELLARRSLDQLSLMTVAPVRVIRNSIGVEIPSELVVIDDLLELKAGEVVPADSKVIQSNELEVDEALISGESEPVSKKAQDELIAGSAVVAGFCVAQVLRVGSATYTGKLVEKIRRYQLVNSEIRNSLNQVVKWISWTLIPIIAIATFGQIQATPDIVDALVSTIAGLISMIPQGLVLITSIAFAVSARRLAKRKVLVKELAAVEILARVDVVCFDKTGTLTEGAMRFHSEHLIDTSDKPYLDWKAVLGHFAHDSRANATAQCLKDVFSGNASLDELSRVPFSSARKWSSFSFRTEKQKTESWVLGAPEFVLRATKENQKVLNQAEAFSANGMRTLVLGFTQNTITGENIPRHTIPIALLCFKEQLNSEISNSLAYLRKQNVAVKILSGDNPRTVAMIAKDAGMVFPGNGFNAQDLPEPSIDFSKLIENEVVFGRVTPEQKSLIVRSFQENGHVVAMFGDGVNDSLALKQADLGIAMGSGASSTKQIANLVLVDNAFSHLPLLIAEGRRVIANVERVSRLFLTKTVWALMLTLVFGALLWKFPFLPRQIAAIDAFTIGIPAFFLALLPNETRYQAGFLKRTIRFCVPAGLIFAASVIALVSLLNALGEKSESQSQTAVSLLLSINALWVLAILMRPFSIPKVLVLVSMCVMGVFIFAFPALASFFEFTQLSASELLLVLLLGGLAGLGAEISHRNSGRLAFLIRA